MSRQRNFNRLALCAAILLAAPQVPAHSPANQSVQAEVDKRATDEADRKRRESLGEAQSAIAATEQAITALGDGKPRTALSQLALATGKLELLLARHPRLALAPVRTDMITHDVLITPDGVKGAVREARRLLGDGEVQKARRLMAVLASEVEFRTFNIPLQTFPTMIKAISPLIDAGNIDEARTRLQAVLSTLVITSERVPLPKLRAEEHIKAAQGLAGKSNRSKEENDRLSHAIQDAREQLQVAELLGYGEKSDYRPMYQQIDDIERKSAGGKSGTGWFEQIKKQLARWG